MRQKYDALRDLGYTDSTIGLRQRSWKEYYDYQGSFETTEESMDKFLLEFYDIEKGNINLNKRQYEARAAIRNLLEFCLYGKIVNYHTPWFRDLPWVESFQPVVEEFIEAITERGLKRQTILIYERTLKRFTNYLHSIEIESFEAVEPSHISSFLTDSINEIVSNLRAMLCDLRVFFRYVYLNGYNANDLSLFIPKSNILMKRKHIPSTWTREDVDRILSCVDVANPVGKRDYAMILLVARLGIQVSDIIHLKFENI
jgi:integrase